VSPGVGPVLQALHGQGCWAHIDPHPRRTGSGSDGEVPPDAELAYMCGTHGRGIENATLRGSSAGGSSRELKGTRPEASQRSQLTLTRGPRRGSA
jgi:hypothetical protein